MYVLDVCMKVMDVVFDDPDRPSRALDVDLAGVCARRAGNINKHLHHNVCCYRLQVVRRKGPREGHSDFAHREVCSCRRPRREGPGAYGSDAFEGNRGRGYRVNRGAGTERMAIESFANPDVMNGPGAFAAAPFLPSSPSSSHTISYRCCVGTMGAGTGRRGRSGAFLPIRRAYPGFGGSSAICFPAHSLTRARLHSRPRPLARS